MKNERIPMKKIILTLSASLLVFIYVQAQQGIYEVSGYNTNTEAPLPFAKKNKAGQIVYDSRILGSPKFFPGYIITILGEKIEGQLAVFNNSADWTFVKRALLIVPTGQQKAQYLGTGTAVIICQQTEKETIFFDYYDGIYLQRLVSGSLRLSYNPAANTSRKVSSFISKSLIDSMIVKSANKDLADGKSLQESLEKAKLKDDAANAFASIEIVEKEYLLYDESTNKTIAITKSNYAEVITMYMSQCSTFDVAELKKYSKDYKKIEELFIKYNEVCK